MITLYIIIGAAAITLAAAVFAVAPRPGARKRMAPFLRDYAHRGLHGKGVPENSLKAFSLAAEKDYGIELDVQLTRDGEVVVFHDYTTDRMTGLHGKISELTYKELSALSLGNTDERIPRLSDVLNTVDGRVPLLIELKGESTDTALCSALAAELEGYCGDYLVESFNPLLLRGFARLCPLVPRGILSAKRTVKGALAFPLRHILLCFLCRVDFVAYCFSDPFPPTARLCTLLGARKLLWTPRNDRQIAKAAEHCHGVIFEDNTEK